MHDFRGMCDRAPLLAAVLAVALFSLAGMPLFAGFLTKFIFFQSVAANGYYWLAALAVVASLISLYYYLYVMREMYVSEPPDDTRFKVPLLTQAAAVVLTIGVFFVGLYPAPLFDADGQGVEGPPIPGRRQAEVTKLIIDTRLRAYVHREPRPRIARVELTGFDAVALNESCSSAIRRKGRRTSVSTPPT